MEIKTIDIKKYVQQVEAIVIYHIFSEFKTKEFFEYSKKNILVFDFGKNTLNLSLVNTKIDDKFNIEANVIDMEEEMNFGGYLLDILFAQKILDPVFYNCDNNSILEEAYSNLSIYIDSYIDKYCKKVFSKDEKTNKLLERYIKEAERVKIELSRSDKCIVDLKPYVAHEVSLDRGFFENLILDNESILKKVKDLLVKFRLKNSVKIDEVIFVGGTSRISKIRCAVEEVFPSANLIYKEEYINVFDTEKVKVSEISNKINVKDFKDNIYVGVLSRDIYLRCNGEESKLLNAGTFYPLKKDKTFEIKVPNSLCESIQIELYEKEERIKYNSSKINFYHPCFFTGDIIVLSVSINESGKLKFKAIHKETKEKIEFE